jgi:hypothetical protein
MSYSNFVPQIWTTTMWKEREKKFVGINNCNRDYEGQIKKAGDRVKISGLGDVTINDYTKNNFDTGLTLQTMDDESTFLYITESKYFNVAVDNIDQAQANQKFMPEIMRKAALAQNDVADQFIFKKYVDAGAKVEETELTSKNIVSTLTSGLQKLYENNVPEGENIVIEVSPAVFIKIWLAKILQDTDNSSLLTNGLKGKFLNTEVYMSNNIQKTGNVNQCIMRTKKAISYAEQYVETKAYDLGKDGFGEAVKGLLVYGGKTVYPKEMVRLDLTPADETTI